jgi:hypothetical protein
MTSTAHFRITYDGPALANSEMEVRSLAPALHAIGDLLEAANRAINGNQSKVAVNVRASFKTGCFGIDLVIVQGWLRDVVDMFNSREVTAAVNILGLLGLSGTAVAKSLIGVLKWLRGRKIMRVQRMNDHAVLFVDEDQLEIELDVLKLLADIETRKALEAVVREPLQREGINVFSSGTDDSVDVTINDNETFWFITPDAEEQTLSELDSEESLQLVAVVFKDDNKWRFSDGASTFYATLADDEFLQRVNLDEERFGKNDLFRVKLTRRQYLDVGGVMRQEVIVHKVIEHTPAMRQLRLPGA